MPKGTIKVKVSARQTRDQYGRYESAIETGLHTTVMELGALGANTARAAAPVRTGRLAASIQMRMLGALTSEFYTRGVPYAGYQEEGTGPKGRAGQFLTNREDFWAIGPVGGTPASRFMEAGGRAVEAAGQGILNANMP